MLDKSAVATGDLIGDKIANKITSIDKKQPKNEQEQEEIIIPPEKNNKLLMI